MKTLILLVMFYCLPSYSELSLSGDMYLKRFFAYQNWSEHLPTHPDAEFLSFISADTPLAKKLRKKWLYQLARQKDWANYRTYYKLSKNTDLQCFAALAAYHEGDTKNALAAAKTLWLVPYSQSKACNPLFDRLFKSDQFREDLITQRIVLALKKRNLHLARYLLKQFKNPRVNDERLLIGIYQNPRRITALEIGALHDEFYLYGLKRMVSINMDQAIKYWRHVKTKKLLSDSQQQEFLAHVALYKAMRNHEDTAQWFAKVKPEFYNDVLLNWHIRYALKRKNWTQVARLIQHSQDKTNPCWQYWLARALEAQGKTSKATTIYQSLADKRHYYGFLASLRLKQALKFQNEPPTTDLSVLKPYQPILDNIKSLYNDKQKTQASRLVNDFISELPKDHKSALLYWLNKELNWHGKSVYLANNHSLHDQLSLRFPLAYDQTIKAHAETSKLPRELIYAIIRQESAFRKEAVSRVGARGLMQIMPSTANQVARSEKIPYKQKEQLFKCKKNINIGVAYLNNLAKRFDGHPVLMAAAYNAGPSQVNRWLKTHPPKQVDIWIETLPWQETRNYLKNVIAFYAVYQYRLQKKPDLSPLLRLIE